MVVQTTPLVSHQPTSVYFPPASPLNINNIKQTENSCTVWTLQGSRPKPLPLPWSYVYLINTSVTEAERSKWAKSTCEKAKLYTAERGWPLLTPHDWLTSHCETHQQQYSCTSVYHAYSLPEMSANAGQVYPEHRLWSQPGLTRPSENPKYTQKSTDGQSIQKQVVQEVYPNVVRLIRCQLESQGATGRKGKGRHITCSWVMGSGAYPFGLLDLHCTWLCSLLHIISSKTGGGG